PETKRSARGFAEASAPFLPASPSPRSRGEEPAPDLIRGRGEGQREEPEQASAPHPGPVPVKNGERGSAASTLPALRGAGAPVRNCGDMTASLNARRARPNERSDRAREVLSQQPMLAQHPLVSGSMPMFMPHRPPRPEKSEGGIAFKIVSELQPRGDQPGA